MATNVNRRLLLHGAIRKNAGNGLVFYQALKDATEADLRSALAALKGKYGEYIYTFSKTRTNAIEQRLKEMESQP